MKENNKKIFLYIVVCLGILLSIFACVFIIQKQSSNKINKNYVVEENNNNNQESIEEKAEDDDTEVDQDQKIYLNNINLDKLDEETKWIFNIVTNSVASTEFGISNGDYADKEFSKYTEIDKINLLLQYVDNKIQKYKVSEEMLNGIKDIDLYSEFKPEKYVKVKDVEALYKRVFNSEYKIEKETDSEGNNISYGFCPIYTYNKKYDVLFITTSCGGGDFPNQKYVYDLSIKSDEINIYVAYVEETGDGIVDKNGKELGRNYKVTEKNLDNFKKFDFKFKKNSEDKFYIDSITRINK